MTSFISHLSLIFALTGFSVSSGLFLFAFPQPGTRHNAQKAAQLFFIAASLLILMALSISVTTTYYSQTSGLILVVALAIVTIYTSLKHNIRLLGIIVSPLATLIILFLAFSYPESNHIVTTNPHLLLKFHIIVSSLGQAFAIAAFAVASFYLFQQRALRKKQFQYISSSTPPLSRLESTLIGSLWAGLSCLTIGLFSGAFYIAFIVDTRPKGMLTKIVWAVLVWLWYLSILVARNVLSFRGSYIAKMSIVGFLLLLAAFFGLIHWETALESAF